MVSSQVLKLASPRKRVEPPERHQKRVLRGVFRLRVRAERRERGPIDRHPVPFDQLAKGGRVPLPGPRDQVDDRSHRL